MVLMLAFETALASMMTRVGLLAFSTVLLFWV
jgi:hypothetical protein